MRIPEHYEHPQLPQHPQLPHSTIRIVSMIRTIRIVFLALVVLCGYLALACKKSPATADAAASTDAPHGVSPAPHGVSPAPHGVASGTSSGTSFGLSPVAIMPIKIAAGDREWDPIAQRNAHKGGSLTTWGGPFPRSFNYWIDSSFQAAQIASFLYEPLVSLHSSEDRPVGVLAKKWWQADGGRTFVFELDARARWSDGMPIVAKDVVFYYDTIMNAEYRTTLVRATVSRFERPKVLGKRTVAISVKKNYWKAFWDASGFLAFPEHAWRNQDFRQLQFEFPIVSGPYSLVQVRKNRYALLQRRADWWGRHLAFHQGKYNFDYIRFRYTSDRIAALEAFKKGDYDLYAIYTSSIWQQQTRFASVQKNWVVRQVIRNQRPLGFQGFAINMRRKKFQDLRVRQALCHSMDREIMNEKLMFRQYFILHSYFPDLSRRSGSSGNTSSVANSDSNSASVASGGAAGAGGKGGARRCEYNLAKARKLLDAAGYTVNAQGLRQKGATLLRIDFITDSRDLRHYQVYIQSLKKIGIASSMQQITAATMAQKVDGFDFDLLWINVSSSRLVDPEALFHSRYAAREASINWAGVEDAAVDGILDALRKEKKIASRKKLLRRLDARLLEIQPFVLLWQVDHSRLLYWNKFSQPQYGLDKFGDESSIPIYWSRDAEREKELSLLRAADLPLQNPRYQQSETIVSTY